MKATDGGTSTGESQFETVSDVTVSRGERYRRRVEESIIAPLRIMGEDWRAVLGLSILGLYTLAGLAAWVSESNWLFFESIVIIAPPEQFANPSVLRPFHEGWISLDPVRLFGLSLPLLPELSAPLGTNRTGIDLLSLMVYSTPPMAQMIAVGAVVATGIATVVGTVSGYKSGWADTALMYLTDIVLTIPGLPFTILLAALFQPEDPWVVGLLLSIDGWPGLTRALRSQVLTIREEAYVEASRTMGLDTAWIVRKDIIPNLMPYIFIHFVNSARAIIYGSVALYFLGVLPYTTLNWGVVLNNAYHYGGLTVNRHWLAVPLFTIVLISFGLVMLAQGTDRIFNPRIRARHMKTVQGDESEPSPMDEVSD